MRTFRLGLFTWNVGGAPAAVPPSAAALLRPAQHCDVVVVGLQEVPVTRRGWKPALLQGLGPSWVFVAGESYAGLRLLVFVRPSQHHPSAPISLRLSPALPARPPAAPPKKVGVGLADRWPNKGAVALELRFGVACSVLFLVAHLAANEHRLQGRQDDWRAILRRLDRDDVRPLARGAAPLIPVPLFHRYQHVFVLGDLNYRIAPPGTDHLQRVRWVHHRIRNRDWPALVDADQLIQQKMGDRVFANFQEADINFAPTFKFDPKTAHYSHARVPSYCDRILWHSLPARVDLVNCTQYTSLVDFKDSDHLPVFGEFELRVPYVVSPSRPLNALKGKRVVLEFMLVRFVKGPGKFHQRRDSFSERPPSMRRIREPQRLHLTSVENLEERMEHGSFLGNMIDDEDDDADEDGIAREEDDDEDDDDEEEEEEDDTSSVSSEEEDEEEDGAVENFVRPIGIENLHGRYNPNASLDAHARSVVMARKKMFESAAAPAAGSNGDDALFEEMEMLGKAFRHVSTGSSSEQSGDGAYSTASPHGSGSGSGSGNRPFIQATSSSGRGLCLSRPQVHANSGPRKRESLSRHVESNAQVKKVKKRRRLNGMRMEVHGQGLFLKRGRVYRVGIPKRVNGMRERIGESLPVIPLAPVGAVDELEFRHVLVEFAKKKSRVGTSGALALRELLGYLGRPFAFEMSLTKYGLPVATMEACVQLTVSDSELWVDAKGRVVRNGDGAASRFYRGARTVRKRTRARSKADGTRREVQ